MRSLIIEGLRFVLYVEGIFNLKCLLIDLVLYTRIFRRTLKPVFLSTKSPFEFVFLCWELKKVIL